jgi:hypothetical protein
MFRSTLSVLLLLSSVANAGIHSIGEPNVTWTKRKIHVCWNNGVKIDPSYAENQFKEEQKLAVQKIVEQEFTIEKVGITFYGWEDCSTMAFEDYDLEIYQDNEYAPSNSQVEFFRKSNAEGYAVLGQGSFGQIQTVTNLITNEETKTEGYFSRDLQRSTMYLMFRPLFRIFSEHFKSNEELQMTALHEFGHVAGLRHEHIHSDAKADPNCFNLGTFKITEQIEDTATQYETYDPNSIMNYCWTATLAENGNVVSKLPNIPDKTLYTVVTDKKTKKKTYTIRVGLSAKDISTLNKMYPKVITP